MGPVLGKAGEHSVAREEGEGAVGSQVCPFIPASPLVCCPSSEITRTFFFFNAIYFASAPSSQGTEFQVVTPQFVKSCRSAWGC